MVMDQFVTTYRKDYLWPYVRTLGLRPHPAELFQPHYNDPGKQQYTSCDCYASGEPQVATDQQLRSLLGPQAYEEEAWSRLGPMGPLLDPKVYPAKVSAAPESQVSRFNQPNVFLVKLQEKYPFIYECLRTAPPDDLLARMNRDRLRTTYQVDYCKMNEYPSGPYDELLRAAGVSGLPPHSEPAILPGDVCKTYTKSKVTSSGGGSRGGQPCGGFHTKSREADSFEEVPTGTPLQMIRTARNDISPPCPKNMIKCGSPCKQLPRNKALRMSTIAKQFVETNMPLREQGIKSGPCVIQQQSNRIFPNFKQHEKQTTTYQDTIGKVGSAIMTRPY